MQTTFMILAGLLGIFALPVVAGAVYQTIGTRRDRRRFPPPGRLVRVNERRMHIHVTGEGTPTVVFESGMGASCLSWTLVQPQLAQFTRAVSYDRSGHDWSDPAREPRTAQQIAQELHTLLDATGVPGPFVLVGHSFGGYVNRAFAHLYRDDVAGMVLVDSIHAAEEEKARLHVEKKEMRRAMKQAAREAAAKATEKERKRAGRLFAMIQGKSQQIQFLTHKVKELQEQLKRGTTPQVEGLNFERELLKDLKKHFPDDRVEHHGKSGDILLCVPHKGKRVGSILFECKLTSGFSGAYVVQTKKAIAERNATYRILVTLASKKGTAGFWVDNDIIVVHRFGAVHVAAVRRSSG